MTKSIKERNRISLALLELSRDRNFERVPHDDRLGLVKEVLNIGEEIAVWISSEYNESDPRKIADKMGVKVFGADVGNSRKSEYRKKEKEIVIFRDALDRLSHEITVPELSERILRYLVAHELFHHIELAKIGPVYKRFKFPGKFGMSFYIKGLSDVAAQAFTQKLLGLEFSPQVFDYLTYILFTSGFKD